ncbi:exopolysaccharide biosynthesis protein [Clostridium sp. P21]|uniref:protein-tyrosine-phosphatase n=1 Tax=Clostridium muellerianum TaxID=2716538 RepID=A0A7Y0HQT5_9CLOT|nr:CpsB/CapC family capsule biosynthesis tyrosine phosphatase [Clostridium muellerianum]NMM65102.1 exopolysaccharide biosynthesis protein [Clostridium muellerianum]
MIDIHTHILPGIDDGSKDMDYSIKMLKIAEDNGIKKIIATPHFYRGYYENKYEDVCKHIEDLKKKIVEISINVEIFPGQEVFLDNHTLELYKDGAIKGLNNSKYVLVEFPMETMPKQALDMLYELKISGAVPIIAHPERYLYFMKKPSLINEFIEEKHLFQLNSGSVKGLFGKEAQKLSHTLIEHNICDFIASDAHSTGRRSPKIEEAIIQGDKLRAGLKDKVTKNAEKILSNDSINSCAEKVKEKKSIFSFLKRK